MVELAIQLAIGVTVALVLTLVVRTLLGRGRLATMLDEDTRRTIVRSLGLLFVVVAVVAVLSGRNEVIRQDLVVGLVSFMPRLIVGVVFFIAAFVLSRLVGVVVAQAMRNRSAVLANRLKRTVAAAILVIGTLLSLKQMGIETDVLMLILAALLGGTALAVGLSIGLGSLPLARQIAAGRHVEDRFRVGQLVEIGDVKGRIGSIQLASVSIRSDDGASWEVPHARFLDQAVWVSDD